MEEERHVSRGILGRPASPSSRRSSTLKSLRGVGVLKTPGLHMYATLSYCLRLFDKPRATQTCRPGWSGVASPVFFLCPAGFPFVFRVSGCSGTHSLLRNCLRRASVSRRPHMHTSYSPKTDPYVTGPVGKPENSAGQDCSLAQVGASVQWACLQQPSRGVPRPMVCIRFFAAHVCTECRQPCRWMDGHGRIAMCPHLPKASSLAAIHCCAAHFATHVADGRQPASPSAKRRRRGRTNASSGHARRMTRCRRAQAEKPRCYPTVWRTP